LYTKEGSEHGISIFDEKVYKSKVFRTEIKVPMERIKPTQTPKAKVDVRAVNQRKPKTFKSSVNITLKKPAQPKTITQRRPTRTPPKVPEGVKPWRPTPKPRTVLPRMRPVPKPRTLKSKVKPVPKPRKFSVPVTMERKAEVPAGPRPAPSSWKKPTESPTKPRKPVKQLKEKELQPPVQEFEVSETDPFGTDLQIPKHRKIETAVNGAAVTYSITTTHLDPLDQLTSSRQVVRNILVNELKRMGGVKYTETLKVRMSKEVGDGRQRKTQCTSSRKLER
jgi:hypothetical protein